MNIVFFGSSQSSRTCLQAVQTAGHRVDLVITQPDRPAGRGRKIVSPPVKELALQLNIPTLQPHRIRKDKEVLAQLRNFQPDLNVVVAYGQIIPAAIIYLPKHNSINLHFSLLPKYRGASPVQWAILHGEEHTGVCVFELNEKMDEGPVLSQRQVSILPGENALQLKGRLARIGSELLVETINQINDIRPIPQDDGQATYARLIKKEDGRIEWSKDAPFIERQVRAFYPWPSVHFFYQEKRVKIIRGQSLGFQSEARIEQGEILSVHKQGIEVGCGGGSVFLIQELQPENRKTMSAYAFSLGASLKPGDKFH